jgi:hypothetical protein
MFNHSAYVDGLAAIEDNLSNKSSRSRVNSGPCLPLSLPSLAVLERDAVTAAPQAVLRQLRRSPSPSEELGKQSQEPDTVSDGHSGATTVSKSSEQENLPTRNSESITRSARVWKEPKVKTCSFFQIFP